MQMRLMLALCFFLSLHLACSRSEKSLPKKQSRLAKTNLVLATNSEPDTLHVMFAEMAASHEILYLGQRELTMYNDKWELVPDLAEELPSIKNNQVQLKDGKMMVNWHIKKDATWEDGVPVTADDFILAWQICLDPTQEIINRDNCNRVESMKAEGVDKKILVVTWKKPFAFFDMDRAHQAVPAHVLSKRYYKPGGGTRDMKKDPYGQHPLSNGPFKFKEWVPGQYLTYVRNDKYKPLAKLQEITFRIIPNNLSIESNLVAGSVDGVTASGGLNVPDVERMKKQHGDRFIYHLVPGLVWAHIDFNLDNPILADVGIRKALAHAVNRKQIIHTLYFDKYQRANSFMPPKHWGYNPNLPQIEFDLKKAATLLDEAGWKQKKPGETRTNAKGEALLLKLSAVAGIKDIEQFQQVFQSDLHSIGVELQIDNKPAKVFFGDLARHRKFPHLSFYSWVSSPNDWSETLWGQNFIPSSKNSWQGQNYPGWRNAEASKLLSEIPSTMDFEQRRKMLQRVQEIWFEELPAIPMYFRPVEVVVRKDLKNYRPTGNLTPVSWNAWEWEFAEK